MNGGTGGPILSEQEAAEHVNRWIDEAFAQDARDELELGEVVTFQLAAGSYTQDGVKEYDIGVGGIRFVMKSMGEVRLLTPRTPPRKMNL